MTPEALQKISEQLDEPGLATQGVFGIFRIGGGIDESCIKANKEGLQLFALELLKAVSIAPQTLADKETIPLNTDESWVDPASDILIYYIEPVAGKQITPFKADYKETFFDKLIPLGCVLSLIILVVAVVVGLATMFAWLF